MQVWLGKMASASFSSQDDLPLVALNAASGGSKDKNGQKMRKAHKPGTSRAPSTDVVEKGGLKS